MSRATTELRPRQVECLRLAARGLNSTEIGGELGISMRTVLQHIDEAKGRLDAQNWQEAISRARALGLI